MSVHIFIDKMENFRKILADEAPFKLSNETMDKFCSIMKPLSLKKKDILIDSGKIDTNIYIVKSGIIRRVYMDGMKEVTVAFALPGTVIISYHSYCYRQPTYHQFEACCDSEIMVVTKEQYEDLVAESHEFARWALNMAQCQLYYNEIKQTVINGDAQERYESLLKNRPEIIRTVSLRIIASYLGVSQAYLSRIRNKIFKKQ